MVHIAVSSKIDRKLKVVCVYLAYLVSENWKCEIVCKRVKNFCEYESIIGWTIGMSYLELKVWTQHSIVSNKGDWVTIRL